MNNTGHTNTVNVVLATTSAVLSLFGTTLIILSYFLWKDIRTTSRRILCYVSIGDFFTAVGTIIGIWSQNKTICLVQSIIGTSSVLSSFFWTIFMALYLYIGVTRRLPVLAQRLMCLFHVFGWGVPVVIVSIAASTGKLGNNGDLVSAGWCWVNVDLPWDEQIKWMLVAGKFWEIAASVIITALYILVKRSMRQERQCQDDKLLNQTTVITAQKTEKKLILIPLAFVLLRVWGTIRFFIMIEAGPNYRPTYHAWLMVLQGIGDSAQGFANFCIFCFFTDKVQTQIKSFCMNSCCAKPFARMVARHRERQQFPVSTTVGINSSPTRKYQTMEANAGVYNPGVSSDVIVEVGKERENSIN